MINKYKYEPLMMYFKKCKEPIVFLTFDEIEEILGDDLPDCLRKNEKLLWNNKLFYYATRSWVDAGYLVESYNLIPGSVTFVRSELSTGEVKPHYSNDLDNTTKHKNTQQYEKPVSSETQTFEIPTEEEDQIESEMRSDFENEINILLSKRSIELLEEPTNNQRFTSNSKADDLIKTTPLAFLIACIMDRQVVSEKAWEIPYEIKKITETLDINVLKNITIGEWQQIFAKHRLHGWLRKSMADNLYYGIQLICDKYDSKPENIWNDNSSASTVIKRFSEFRGIGQKISTMAVNILARNLKVIFKDLRGIDVSVDVHVKRVMQRLSLVNTDDCNVIINKARHLNPDYPGIIDLSLWEIGKNYCHTENPECNICFMNHICPKIISALR